MTLNLVPMIDIVFNLLIFFLVATRFTVAEGVLPGQLPGVDAPTTLAVPLPPIRLHLSADPAGQCAVAIEDSDVQPVGFDELAAALTQLQQEAIYDRQTPVVLIADPDLAWDHVVNAYNAALRAGFDTIVFGGQ